MSTRVAPRGLARSSALFGLALGLLATDCAKKAHDVPTAVISALGAQNDSGALECQPLRSALGGRIGAAVPLTAACSSDPSHRSLAYSWSLAAAPSGAVPSLENTDSVTPTFVPDATGAYRLRLVVSNGATTSDPTFADVAVTACGGNAPHVMPTCSDVAPHVGELVTLAANVTDPDTEPSCGAHAADFTYAWALVGVPAGSHAALNATSVAEPSFVLDAPGTYVVRVVATDPTGRKSDPAELTIDAGACGSNAPVIGLVTSAPAAPQTGETITLGASVTDPDTDATCDAHPAVFTYAWSFTDLPPGSNAMLNDASIEHPSFVADVAGTYALALVATDPTGRDATATVNVDVGAASTDGTTTCGKNPPVAAAWRVVPGPVVDCSVPLIPTDLQGSDKLMLDAVPSSDPDNLCGETQALEYHWTLLATPIDGGPSRLSGTDSRTTVLEVTSEGEYQVRLVVTDSTGRSSSELVCSLYAYNLG